MKILHFGLTVFLLFVFIRTLSSKNHQNDVEENFLSVKAPQGSSKLFIEEQKSTESERIRIGKENVHRRERRKASLEEEEGWFVFNQNSVFCFIAMAIFTIGMLVSVYLACCKDEKQDKGMIGDFMRGGMPF